MSSARNEGKTAVLQFIYTRHVGTVTKEFNLKSHKQAHANPKSISKGRGRNWLVPLLILGLVRVGNTAKI